MLHRRAILLPHFDRETRGQLGHQPILQLEQIVEPAVDLDGRRAAGPLATSIACAVMRMRSPRR